MVTLLAGPRSLGIFGQTSLGTARNWLRLNQSQEAYWFLVRTVFSISAGQSFSATAATSPGSSSSLTWSLLAA